MPKLNGEVVQVGDRLYDIANGVGNVTVLTEKSIEVLFDTGRRVTYNQVGALNGVRRLYWQYPVFIDPPKDLSAWEKTRNALLAIQNIITEARS